MPHPPEGQIQDTSPRPRRAALRAEPGRRRAWDVLAVIALGGGLGSAARYLAGLAIPAVSDGFPWATFLINVLGCLALGFLMVFVLEVWPPRRYVRPFLAVGVLGGFTTFSTYTAEVLDRLDDGLWALADSYAVDSLLAGLAAVWCGIALGRAATKRPVRRFRHGRQAARPAQPEQPEQAERRR
ncbi:MAG TPA: fluoride efflux transporter CrcB [Thermopolyspora sp.]